MIRKTIYILLLAVFPLAAAAQNSIDRVVGEFSTTGNAEFTSVVQRNPKTRAIEKVVKKLTTGGHNSLRIVKTFNNEAARHSCTTNVADGFTTKIFTETDERSNRVYMMKHSNGRGYRDVEITIIIKVK